MIITEAELRQFWQNGRGSIPEFPAGTRFTPAALDFLKAIASIPVPPPGGPQGGGGAPAAAPPLSGGGWGVAGSTRLLQAPPGHQRLIYTTQDLDELLAGNPTTLVLHPSVTVTDAAKELLRGKGVRIVPYVEPAAPAVGELGNEELVQVIKKAVLARMGGSVDEGLVEKVVRRVIGS